MNYAVTVDTSRPEGTPELDELQRAGVIHLLREAFDAVDAIEGEDGEVVEITDTFLGVHPEGALLKVFVDAPSLEDAEAAVEALIGEIFERCEPLADWSVDKCKVELHLDSARESLEAAEGPGAPGADPMARAAAHRRLHPSAESGRGADSTDPAEKRAALRALASRLAGVGLAAFGHLTAQDVDDEEEFDEGFTVGREGAELAAGAVLYSVDILLDELFQDVDALGDGPSVAQCDGVFFQLEGLPEQFAHLYTPLFARKLLVTAPST
ncbi:hypothetical protein ACPC54_08040 [Kitasatospora sp. NPDC094028]